MKNLGYFMVGLVLLPIRGLVALVTYIRDYGKDFVKMYKLGKRLKG